MANIRTIDYGGFNHATGSAATGSGFMIWSGSMQLSKSLAYASQKTQYYGVGIEAIAHSGSYLRFQTDTDGNQTSSLDIKTNRFFLGSDAAFISGSGDGTIAISSSNFELDESGAVVMQGQITATAGGTIGGFAIGTNSLTATNFILNTTDKRLTLGSGNDIFIADADDGIQLGHATFASAPFSVTKAGALKAISGEIAGWTISSTFINSVNSDGGVKIDAGNRRLTFRTGSGYHSEILAVGNLGGFNSHNGSSISANSYGIIALDSADPTKTLFKLGEDGNEIAGWTISSTQISKIDSGGGIKIDSTEKEIGFRTGSNSDTTILTLGEIATGKFGILGLDSTDTSKTIFKLGEDGNEIAGWTFDNEKLTGGAFEINKAGYVKSGTKWKISSSADLTDDVGFISSSEFKVSPGGVVTGSAILLGNKSTNNFLQFDSGTLTVAGTITADNIRTPSQIGGATSTDANASSSIKADGFARFTSASIANWEVSDKYIRKIDGTSNAYLLSDGIGLSNEHASGKPVLNFFNTNSKVMVNVGNIYKNSGNTGFALFSNYNNNTKLFEVSEDDGNGTITAQIAGWTFDESKLTGGNLILNKEGSIKSSDYVSNFSGFSLSGDSGSFLEVENAKIRGTLSTAVFEKETVNAVGGQLYVANSTALTGSVIPGQTSQGGLYTPANTTMSVVNVTGFEQGEILSMKKVSTTGFATEYVFVNSSSRQDGSSETNFSGNLMVTRGYGTGVTATDVSQSLGEAPGSAQSYSGSQVIVSTGKLGTGFIRLNANPNDQTTPYIDIVERTGSGIYDLSLKTRLGDLSGINDPRFSDDVTGFGIYTENGYFKGKIEVAAPDGAIQHRIYARGTDYSHRVSHPALVQVGNSVDFKGSNPEIVKGHNLFIISESADGIIETRFSESYDTHTDVNNGNALAAILTGSNYTSGQGIEPTDLIIVVTEDASGFSQHLFGALTSSGATNPRAFNSSHVVQSIPTTTTSRTPYALVGQLFLGKGNGFEAVGLYDSANHPTGSAIIEGYYTRGRITANQQNAGTIIDGNKISTGRIVSNNYGSTKGTEMDLDGEVIRIGGSGAASEGIVLDGSTNGQPKFFVGDSTNFLKFNHTSGKLEINTDNFDVNAAGDVTMTGQVTANTGQIGGFTIDAHSLTTTGVEINNSTQTTFISSSNFKVSHTGDVTASNVDLSGKVTAAEGAIGGWALSANSIGSGSSQNQGDQAIRFNNKSTAGSTVYQSNLTTAKGLHIQTHESNNASSLIVGEIISDANGNYVHGASTAFNEWYGIQGAHWNDTTPFFQLAFKATGTSFTSNNSIAGWTFDNEKLSGGAFEINKAGYLKSGTKWMISSSANNADAAGFISSSEFKVSADGRITASGALIDGNSKFQGNVTITNPDDFASPTANLPFNLNSSFETDNTGHVIGWVGSANTPSIYNSGLNHHTASAVTYNSNVSIVHDSGSNGSNVLEFDYTSTQGEIWTYSREAFEVDTSHTYRMTVRAKLVSGATDGGFHAGFNCMDANGDVISESPGSHRYFAAGGGDLTETGVWQIRYGEITGEGGLISKFKTGTKYVRPMFILGHDDKAAKYHIDYVYVENLTTGEVSFVNRGSDAGVKVKKNFSDFGTPNNGEMYIHGYNLATGEEADVSGSIFYRGGVYTLPAKSNQLLTAQNVGTTGDIYYIVMDTRNANERKNPHIAGGPGFDTFSTTTSSLAVAKLDGTQWQFDPNGTFTNFTPDDNFCIIGRYNTSAADNISKAEVFYNATPCHIDHTGSVGTTAAYVNPTLGGVTNINGNMITTGVIKSANFSTTAGSRIDLDDGEILMGGTANPGFKVDSDGLVIATNFAEKIISVTSANSGSYIELATVDSVAGVRILFDGSGGGEVINNIKLECVPRLANGNIAAIVDVALPNQATGITVGANIIPTVDGVLFNDGPISSALESADLAIATP